jgi:photosystem II stability/assembly factor-like uncharacterized protein
MTKTVLSFLLALLILASACTPSDDYDFSPSVEKIQLPESIKIRSVEFFNNSHGLLCGGHKNNTGSIYFSEDGGLNWTIAYKSDSLSINDIFFLNDSIVFACGDSLMFLKSTDGGKNWSVVDLGNRPYETYYVPYNNVYANSETNVFLVGGEHFNKGLWSRTLTGNYPWVHDSYDNQLNSICFISEYVGFFGGYGILFVTEDGGNTFDYIDLSGNDFVAIDNDEYNNIYVLSENGKLHKSTDIGYNWTSEIDSYSESFSDIHFGLELAAVCGSNSCLYVMGAGSFLWTKTKNLPNANFNCVFVKDNNEIFLGSENGEIYVLNKKRTP